MSDPNASIAAAAPETVEKETYLGSELPPQPGQQERNRSLWSDAWRELRSNKIFIISAILIFFSGIQIPDMIMKPVSFIGDITPALSMIVLGSILAEYPARSLLKEKTIWPVAVFRLAVIPLIIWACTLPFVSDPTLSGIILITNAMPCGAMCAMLSAKYDGNEQLASTGVFATTMISLVTIPVLCMTLLSQPRKQHLQHEENRNFRN